MTFFSSFYSALNIRFKCGKIFVVQNSRKRRGKIGQQVKGKTSIFRTFLVMKEACRFFRFSWRFWISAAFDDEKHPRAIKRFLERRELEMFHASKPRPTGLLYDVVSQSSNSSNNSPFSIECASTFSVTDCTNTHNLKTSSFVRVR